jgi:hypothetical protein
VEGRVNGNYVVGRTQFGRGRRSHLRSETEELRRRRAQSATGVRLRGYHIAECWNSPIRCDGSWHVLHELRELGVTRSVLISGDRTENTLSVARQVCNRAYGDLLPEQYEFVREIRGANTIMVGMARTTHPHPGGHGRIALPVTAAASRGERRCRRVTGRPRAGDRSNSHQPAHAAHCEAEHASVWLERRCHGLRRSRPHPPTLGAMIQEGSTSL